VAKELARSLCGKSIPNICLFRSYFILHIQSTRGLVIIFLVISRDIVMHISFLTVINLYEPHQLFSDILDIVMDF
jgi:hypothetical protein